MARGFISFLFCNHKCELFTTTFFLIFIGDKPLMRPSMMIFFRTLRLIHYRYELHNQFFTLCLTLGMAFAQGLAAQSLYSDALELSKIIQQLDKQKKGDSLWFRLSQSAPYFTLGEASLQTFDLPATPTESGDYFLFCDGNGDDTLRVVEKNNPRHIIFQIQLKYRFYRLSIDFEEAENEGVFRLFGPQKELARFSVAAPSGLNFVVETARKADARFFFNKPASGLAWTYSFPSEIWNKPRNQESDGGYLLPHLSPGAAAILRWGGRPLLKLEKPADSGPPSLWFCPDSVPQRRGKVQWDTPTSSLPRPFAPASERSGGPRAKQFFKQ
jgi:hypothetical protein